MTFLAIILPCLSFFLKGKIGPGIVCFILQLTLIGWLPAAIWAVGSLHNARAEKRNEDLIRTVLNSNSMNIYS